MIFDTGAMIMIVVSYWLTGCAFLLIEGHFECTRRNGKPCNLLELIFVFCVLIMIWPYVLYREFN